MFNPRSVVRRREGCSIQAVECAEYDIFVILIIDTERVVTDKLCDHATKLRLATQNMNTGHKKSIHPLEPSNEMRIRN